ncbi:hypothetical protein ACWDZ4_22060 [Streptomyces sp. NPDC003016]
MGDRGRPAGLGNVQYPAKGSLRVDAVLMTGAEAGLPVLFVEVGHGTETRPPLAKRLTDYRRFFRRTLKGTDQREISFWRTLYDNNVTAPAQADEKEKRQRAAEREARRPVGERCGEKFTDERWEETRARGGAWKASDLSVCGSCHADDVARKEAAAEAAHRQAAYSRSRRTTATRMCPLDQAGWWCSGRFRSCRAGTRQS